MTNLILKLIALPIILIAAGYFFTDVNFGSIWQPIMLGIILAIVGVALEAMFLRQGDLWLTVLSDFIVAAALIWVLSNQFNAADVTLTGAVLAALIISVMEYFVHRYLITSGRAGRTPVA